MSPTSPLSRPSSLINDLISNTPPHSIEIPSTLPDPPSTSASVFASVPSSSSADDTFLESDCANLVTSDSLSASSLVASHSSSFEPSINPSSSTSIPSASSTQLGTQPSKDRTPDPLQPQSQSCGFGNLSGTICSPLLNTNTHQTLINPLSPPSSASSYTTAYSPLSSQPPAISPPLPASKSVSTSLSPSKPRRDFLGLDLHLGPLLPRNSILSSSSGSKSGTSFFASRSNKSKKSYKSISTSSASPRPSTASSTLSGSLQIRGSHHRFSFQPPSRPSAEQGAVSSLRPIPHTLPSPQVVISPIQTAGSEACEETSVRLPQVQSIYHPFASPASAPSTAHFSQSAPHISSLTHSLSGPPRTRILAKLPSSPSSTPEGRASTKAVSGKGI